MKKVAAAVSLLIAVILFGCAISTIRDRANGAADSINDGFRHASSDTQAQFDSYIANGNRAAEADQQMEIIEFVSGGAFLVASLVLFASGRKAPESHR